MLEHITLSEVHFNTPRAEITYLAAQHRGLKRKRLFQYADYRRKIDKRPDMEARSFAEWLKCQSPCTKEDLDFAEAICRRHFALTPPKNRY